MTSRIPSRTFLLAPMSPVIRIVTLVLLALPVPFVISVGSGNLSLATLITVIYAWIWLRFRPHRFVVHDQSLEIIWPLKRREIGRDTISDVRLFDRQKLKQETGWSMRVGAGGLGGGFGWLWTTRHGLVQMYVSRTDRFVWIDRTTDRPWLLTPDDPEGLVPALPPSSPLSSPSLAPGTNDR